MTEKLLAELNKCTRYELLLVTAFILGITEDILPWEKIINAIGASEREEISNDELLKKMPLEEIKKGRYNALHETFLI